MINSEDIDPYGGAATASINYDMEWNTQFHGVAYVINVKVEGAVLFIDAEHLETNQRWSGEFTSQYIEEITLKAGNYKKFSVFAKMIRSAMSRETDSLFIDLLTFSDLETLKAKKMANTSSFNMSQSAASASLSKSQLKRYLILTYSGEYDRVHYPLPMNFEEIPNVEALKRTIRRLRTQVDKPKEDAKRSIIDGNIDPELRATITQLRLENVELKHRVRLLQSRSKAPESPSRESKSALAKLKKEFDAVKRQLAEVSAAYVSLKKERRTAYSASPETFRRGLAELQKSPAYDPYVSSSRRKPFSESGRNISARGGAAPVRHTLSDDENLRSTYGRRRDFKPPQKSSSPYRGREASASPQRRFDPTAYHQQRRDQMEWQAAQSRAAAAARRGRSESGYMSSSSHDSERSRGSKASDSSKRSKNSTGSNREVGERKPPKQVLRDRNSSATRVAIPKASMRPPLPLREEEPSVTYQELRRQAMALTDPKVSFRDPIANPSLKKRNSPVAKENVIAPSMEVNNRGGEAQFSRKQNKGLNDSAADNSAALSRSVESIRSKESHQSGSNSRQEEISEIDKRIVALRSYLDNARSGIMEDK